MSTSLGLMAFALAWVFETCLYGHRAGPGWVCLVAVAVGLTVRLQRMLERPAARWTWLLWAWPGAAAVAQMVFDADVVHRLGPLMCCGGILVAGYWSLVGQVAVDRFAQPLPECWWWGLIHIVPEGVEGVRVVRMRKANSRLLKRIGVGLTVSIPLVALFGTLLSADQAFSDFLAAHLGALSFDWMPRLFRIGIVWILALGWLRVLMHKDTQAPPPLPDAGQVDPLVVAIPIGMLNGLFALFLALQAEYLFGGRHYASRPNLPYSTYLHQGYFEMVAVTVLTFIVVCVAYRLSYRQEGGNWPMALSGALILQGYGVAASAMERFTLYTQAYGLTVERIYAGAGLIVACGLMAVVLYGVLLRRPLSWLTARLSLYVALAGAALCLVNVDGWIAQGNVAAMLAHRIPVDYAYIDCLSADAVPALIAAAETAPPEDRRQLEAAVTVIMERSSTPAWQDANWSRWQADHLTASVRRTTGSAPPDAVRSM